jgi:amino acid transporter
MKNEAPHLKRHIGLFALTVYGVGDILGAGIYGLVGKAAGSMGNAVWLGFLVSMTAAMLTGLSYAALGSRFPRAAGGSYVVFKVFKSPFFAYLIGLTTLASGLTSMATASRAFSGYVNGLLPVISPDLGIFLFSTLLALIVYRGIKESIWANTLCTVIEFTGLMIVIFVGVSFLGSVNYLDATSAINPTGELTISLMFSGAVLTFYSFVGFEDILNVSEEVKDPKKTVPRALILAVVISSAIYMIVSLVAVSVLSIPELASSTQPLVDVVRRAAPWFPSQIFSIIALFAVANTALLNFLMGSRLIYGLSRLHLAPKILDYVHQKRLTPSRAVLFIYFVLLVLAYAGDISTMAKATSFLLLMVFSGMNLSLAYLKWKKDQTPTGFDVPIFIPILGLVVCLVMMSFAKSAEMLVAAVILVVIVGLYLILRPSHQAVVQMLEQEDPG